MAVKIKLKRLGKIRAPYYRIVVADARTKRDGRAIEEIGKYHPKADPSLIEVDSDRAQHWLSVGAQPTDPVRKILEVTGDWQKFKGLPGAEGTLQTAAPKADRKEIFAAAARESAGVDGSAAKGRARSGAKDSGGTKDSGGKDRGAAAKAGKKPAARSGKAARAADTPAGAEAAEAAGGATAGPETAAAAETPEPAAAAGAAEDAGTAGTAAADAETPEPAAAGTAAEDAGTAAAEPEAGS